MNNNVFNKTYTPKYDNDTIPLWYFKQEMEKLKQSIEEEKVISGSNTNGYWTKYADGTMICYASVTAEVNFTTSWYNDYSGTMDLGYFPQRFVEVPKVLLNNACASAATIQNYVLMPTEAHPGSIFLTRPFSSTTDITIDIIAIGKWK